MEVSKGKGGRGKIIALGVLGGAVLLGLLVI